MKIYHKRTVLFSLFILICLSTFIVGSVRQGYDKKLHDVVYADTLDISSEDEIIQASLQTVTFDVVKTQETLPLVRAVTSSSSEPQEVVSLPKIDETPVSPPEQESKDETIEPVIVEAKIDPAKPMIALTFDDGPSKYTLQILKTLKKYNAKATFFVVGNRVSNFKKTIIQENKEGHEVLSHTWDHSNLTKLSSSSIKSQLNKTNKAIEEAIGIVPKSFRPPYGSVNSKVKEAAKDLGMSMILWSVDTNDWKTRNANSTYKHIMNYAKDGSIVLCHDLYAQTADAMELVIPALIKKGYQLVTIHELFEYSEKTLTPGVTYSKQ
jgi:peptidoglycan/xylan/chitin deacetylase (PgdA/CDA1 family)